MLTALERFFSLIITASAMGSVLILMIIVVKMILGDKLHARWSYYIWLVLLVRLIIPLAPESPTSIFNFFTIDKSGYIIMQQESKIPAESAVDDKTINNENIIHNNINMELNKSMHSSLKQDRISVSTLNAFFAIWILGVMFLLIYTLFLNFKLLFGLRGKVLCNDDRINRVWKECREKTNIKTSIPIICDDSIKRPMIVTFFRSKLLLPKTMMDTLSEDELKHIFLHELVHIKRGDTFIQWFMVMAQILHWFNPLVWYALQSMKLDSEIACDAAVLSYIGDEKHSEYGMTIIRTLEMFSKQSVIPGASSFIKNKTVMKRRIAMISKFKQYHRRWSIVAIGIIVSLVLIGSTNPITSKELDISNIELVDSHVALAGYSYDEETGRYVNESTGIWYVVENGYRLIPPEEYFDPNIVESPDGINIANRPDNVWKLKDIELLTIKEGQTLGNIITQYSINHFRMNRDWYSKQVLYINGIEDPHFIKAGDVLQMPIYIDSGIEGVTDYIGTDKKAIPKAEFIQHIKNSILTGYEEITIKEWKEENTEALIAPKYLPERFQYYGVFVQDNPGIPTEKMTSQLWYDYDKLEILLVTQMKNQSSNSSGKFVFTDSLEGEGKIRDVFPWAKFRSNYDFNQNGISVYGYMLVNDEANKDECERILKSMHD